MSGIKFSILLTVVFTCFFFISRAQPDQLLQQGQNEMINRNYPVAIVFLNEYISQSTQSTPLSQMNTALQQRALAYTQMAMLDSAKADYLVLLNRFQKENNITKTCTIYLLLSKLSRENSQFDSSLAYSEKAILLASHTKDSVLIAKSNISLGMGYYSKSLFSRANDYFLDALRIADNNNDSLTAAEASFYLGVLSSETSGQTESIKMIELALTKFIQNKQYKEAGDAYMSLGVDYKRLKKYNLAVENYKTAMIIADTLNEKRLLAKCYHNLSDVYTYMSKFDSALFYNNKSVLIYKSLGSKAGIILSQNSRGQLYRVMGDETGIKSNYEKALPLFLEDLEMAKIIAYREYIAKCYEELSYCYDGLGDHKKAFNFFYDYHLLNESIRNEKTANRIADLQVKYDTEKKENEITKLNSEKLLDNEKIARQKTINYSLLGIATLFLLSGGIVFKNVQKKRIAEKHVAILEKQNAIESMRSKIAGDVHDDMGANLTKIGLNAQQLLTSSNSIENQKQLAEKIVIQSKEIITGMREIIWASNPANDNLKSMLGFMRQYIDRFFDGTNIRPVVNFPHDAGEIALHPEVRRNLFLILKESLNNAIKYSGSDKIDIYFSNENEKFNLHIKDYGKGMDNKTKDDFSNGLRNMQIRAEQIQSLFKLTSVPGSGVQISVEGNLY